ncbi:unnamed protein product [Vitrella brassicaformis CCMP3155]|uniref:protein-disulfide reductase n=2 Tax=Vitrella brassicaformis TaxID=1169539 RepID=A0A0G4H035_VITBC|nr:unnamed protein product [Vitrella brassicaformis CCMP3155]|mmetsp:Transcript_31709/g.78572  ORF Transcript_31709/g.78572 Transcript_31709/m.78572 type:complete len:197 (+) Transcript_31709:197-787(+)|eukprot:CEM36735.1 unnamed protein product [Vitrella brassicaformis CCMP3155]
MTFRWGDTATSGSDGLSRSSWWGTRVSRNQEKPADQTEPGLLLKFDPGTGKPSALATDTLNGKHVGLFFAAEWCIYCKGFLPFLLKVYRILQPKKIFEVVYVPCDRDPETFQRFASSMPWPTLPLENYGYLIKKYGINVLPTVVVVAPDDTIIHKNAVGMMRAPGGEENFETFLRRWKPTNGDGTSSNDRFFRLFK